MALAAAGGAEMECKDNSGRSTDPKNCRAVSDSDGKTQLSPFSLPSYSNTSSAGDGSDDSTSSAESGSQIRRDNVSAAARVEPSDPSGGASVGGDRCASGGCRTPTLEIARGDLSPIPSDGTAAYEEPTSRSGSRSGASPSIVVQKPAVLETVPQDARSSSVELRSPTPSVETRTTAALATLGAAGKGSLPGGSWLDSNPPALQLSASQCRMLESACP